MTVATDLETLLGAPAPMRRGSPPTLVPEPDATDPDTASPTVGLCVVSHSPLVAEGVAAMARQMVGSQVRIEAAGGNPDGELGTDVGRIQEAVRSLMGPAGVAILFDLGGAETNAEMAVELLGDLPGPVRLCHGPLVEGAVVAAVEASGGADLDAVVAAVQAQAAAVDGEPVEDAPAEPAAPGIPSVEKATVLTHPGGLHARPCVRLVQLAKRHAAAELKVGDGRHFVTALSLSEVLSLRLPAGANIVFRASGLGARAAVDAAIALIEGLEQVPTSSGLTGGGRADDVAGAAAARVAAPGLAIGPVWVDTTVPVEPEPLGDVWAEAERLDTAILQARRELTALSRAVHDDAAAILAVQIELLNDPALVEPVRRRIIAGDPAAVAWRLACGELVARQKAATDPYLQARAADLEDVSVRVLRAMAGHGSAVTPPYPPDNAIVLTDVMTPSRFLSLDWRRLGGVAQRGGSATCHVAVLARARRVPMLVRLGTQVGSPSTGTLAILDAERAEGGTPALILNPTEAQIADAERRQTALATRRESEAAWLTQPAVCRNGQKITVMVTIDTPAAIDTVSAEYCDGIGLARTEFLWDGNALPGEEAQFDAYVRLLRWAGGRPVIVRTMDLGGDKPMAGLSVEEEANPFLGVRGIRLSLANPGIFRVQLRALARAAAAAPGLKVMLPMVTRPEEVEDTRALFGHVVAELKAEGIPAEVPPLGITVEVPAAALTIERFDVAFVSIGTNDL
ncbi:MAG: PTS-dependent dihydroxyacetone kinase phosphotransferase subunit DhaM, partial [Rhodospirillaceae bacterium]|nr:PTS-dependent dihydroxyacetone kinase phosphotransferase subunit DhaM [Rhodospirillaceae bacterium]